MGDPYTLLGCYVDQSPNRTLPVTAYQHMTTNRATVCHALCNAPEYGATLFGLEYGAECYCGAGDPHTFQKAASPAECGTPCPANASEMCGGDWRLSLYRIRDTTLDPSPAATAPPTGPSSSSSAGAGDGGNNGTAGSGSGDDQHNDSVGGKQNLTGGPDRRDRCCGVRHRGARGRAGAGSGTAEREAAGGASGAEMAGAGGSAAGARAGDSSNNSREGRIGSGKAKAAGQNGGAGGAGTAASIDGESLVAGAPYHHHPHNDELPGYQSSAR
ncbi:heme peroxidase [Apiospora aurea]|uniref:Heme peroxidase n=1 Tax=Apiospora aurea TaxID=335848 RepID=A0ABR1QPN6_9PEZI